MLIEWARSVAFRTYTNSFPCYDNFYNCGNNNALVIPKEFFQIVPIQVYSYTNA